MSREKGDKLEERVAIDLGINKTTNSGAKWDNADLTNREYIIECKVKGADTFKPCGTELKKLIAQAVKHNKEWIYIQSCNNQTYVVIDYDYFLEMWQKINT